MDDRISRLPEKQREVLRLVYQLRTTGEIAAILGISEDGVNKRIERARKLFGGLPRREVARILADAEGLEPYNKIVVAEIALAEVADLHPDRSGISPEAQWQVDRSGGVPQTEDTVFYTPTDPDQPPLPPQPGRRNTYDTIERISLMMLATAIFAAGAAAFLWAFGHL